MRYVGEVTKQAKTLECRQRQHLKTDVPSGATKLQVGVCARRQPPAFSRNPLRCSVRVGGHRALRFRAPSLTYPAPPPIHMQAAIAAAKETAGVKVRHFKVTSGAELDPNDIKYQEQYVAILLRPELNEMGCGHWPAHMGDTPLHHTLSACGAAGASLPASPSRLHCGMHRRLHHRAQPRTPPPLVSPLRSGCIEAVPGIDARCSAGAPGARRGPGAVQFCRPYVRAAA